VVAREVVKPESPIFATEHTESNTKDVGQSIDQSLRPHFRGEELTKAIELKRSSQGTTLLTIGVGLLVK
jgi:hypothetical protein